MDFMQLIEKRRSVRQYAAAQVSVEELLTLADAARMAPSWKNSQTARVYIAASAKAIAQVRDALPSFNSKRTENAAAYLVTGFVKGDSGFNQGEPANEGGDLWGAYDLGLHNAYMLLRAADMGLDTLIMGLRDEAKLRAALSVPDEVQIMSVIAVGKRSAEPLLNDRKPLTDTVTLL